MASVEVLNLPEAWPNRSALYPLAAGSLARGAGGSKSSGRFSEKPILETRLSLVARAWVDLCASLKVRGLESAYAGCIPISSTRVRPAAVSKRLPGQELLVQVQRTLL